jgi:hypothetical protein
VTAHLPGGRKTDSRPEEGWEMLVRNIRWVGVATEHYSAMVDLLESTMGLQKKFEEPTTVEFTTVDGDAIQVMDRRARARPRLGVDPFSSARWKSL